MLRIMKFLKFISFLFLFMNMYSLQAQNSYTSTQINTIISDSSAGEGDLYYDMDNDLYYLGVTDGSLTILSDFQPTKISNDLYFEDDDYMFVSMKVGNDDYKVVRYTKTDINEEKEAIGTGVQPSDLVSVQALTYL